MNTKVRMWFKVPILAPFCSPLSQSRLPLIRNQGGTTRGLTVKETTNRNRAPPVSIFHSSNAAVRMFRLYQVRFFASVSQHGESVAVLGSAM